MQVGRLEIIAYSGNDKSEFTNNNGDPEEEERFLPSYADGLGVEPIRLSIRRIGFRPLTMSLTSYTVKELEAMKGSIVGAFDIAMERSAVLDAEAHRQSPGRCWRKGALCAWCGTGGPCRCRHKVQL